MPVISLAWAMISAGAADLTVILKEKGKGEPQPAPEAKRLATPRLWLHGGREKKE